MQHSIGKAMDALDDIIKLSGNDDDWPEMGKVYNCLGEIEVKFDKTWNAETKDYEDFK